MDDADASDKKIQDVVAFGIKCAEAAAKQPPQYKPRTHYNGEETVGLCLWCECEIEAGKLFCPPDEIEPAESCHVRFHHAQKRKKEIGL